MGYLETKLKAMMDYISEGFYSVDQKQRGYFYGWELTEYFNNGKFKDLELSEELMTAFLRFSGEVAGLDSDEKESMMGVKVKYSFLLSQIEQNLYIRF